MAVLARSASTDLGTASCSLLRSEPDHRESADIYFDVPPEGATASYTKRYVTGVLKRSLSIFVVT
jgi:hypothetical protein